MNRRHFLGMGLGATALAPLTGCAERRAAAGPAASIPALPPPRASASSRFWAAWGDGKAELSGYRATSMRYGAPRTAEIVLIYVTEPHDPITRVKDDAVSPAAQILKLNACERFQTGVYPYSVMTSVFCPVDHYGSERFQPSKITLTAQEWCGHVSLGLWPQPGGARMRGASYFASEGDVDAALAIPEGALFEDALAIQLRELDGPFAGGAAQWTGSLVPSLWRNRKAHVPLAHVPASIVREARAGEVHFALTAGDYSCRYRIEDSGARRLLGWTMSDGSTAEILGTERLAYWELNKPGDEAARAKLGL